MAIEAGTFEELHHSFRYLSFTFPNPIIPSINDHNLSYYNSSLRVAVLDSPSPNPKPNSVVVAAMLVPIGREQDWIFSSENGQRQLLQSAGRISRLILIGNFPQINTTSEFPRIFELKNNEAMESRLKESLTPLLMALSPRFLFWNGRNAIPWVPFLDYEDNLITQRVVKESVGKIVGKMVIEDVEIEIEDDLDGSRRELRRRLRFERMPNLIQSEVALIMHPDSNSEPVLDLRRLVHPYLPPMAASLSLAAQLLEECFTSGCCPNCLCIGVGGGALLNFLKENFNFNVFGVEMDEMVLRNATDYFGLREDELLRVFVGNGIDWLFKFACRAVKLNLVSIEEASIWKEYMNCESSDENWLGSDALIHVIMIDVDVGDAKSSTSAPPVEFVSKEVVLACKIALHNNGILVVNVITECESFYDDMKSRFKEFFAELYEIEVGNDSNRVLVAVASPVCYDFKESSVVEKLRQVVDGRYIDQIRKV